MTKITLALFCLLIAFPAMAEEHDALKKLETRRAEVDAKIDAAVRTQIEIRRCLEDELDRLECLERAFEEETRRVMAQAQQPAQCHVICEPSKLGGSEVPRPRTPAPVRRATGRFR